MIYAFIPARSGSTRLSDKNIRKLAGKPLIGWTLEAAMKSKKIDKVIFSSNSEKYIKIAKDLTSSFKKELLVDHRSETHSGTKSKIFDYLKGELLDKLQFKDGDMLVQLLPTSPLRQAEHIDEAISLAQEKNCGVFAVCEYNFHVSFAFEPLNNNDWKPLFPDSPLLTGDTQSQNQVKYLHPNGSINCLPISLLRQQKPSIYHGCCYYQMDQIDSIDIDDLNTFELSAAIIRSRQ